MDIILASICFLNILIVIMLTMLLLRRSNEGQTPRKLEIIEKELERLEKVTREESKISRQEIGKSFIDLRSEINTSNKGFLDSLLQQLEALRKSYEEKFTELQKGVAERIDILKDDSGKGTKQLKEEVSVSLKAFNDSIVRTQSDIAGLQKQQLDSFAETITKLTDSNEKRHDLLKESIEKKLSAIQDANEKKLEEMRLTVDEKLQGTLEKRLGESFKQVSERLEQVQKGLGEMQTLTTGVGNLKQLLTNIKTRGTWGEIQLGSILDEMLSPDQFERNVRIRKNSPETVEFAVRFPGSDEAQGVLYLPIDSKFPKEDYERLQSAQEKADGVAAEEAGASLEAQIKKCARDIRDKYIHPPYSTDFAIMFLPVESLFAEVLRRRGLIENLQREYRVTVAGPTNLAALLNSLQMGFQTLKIQKNSSEIGKVLQKIKSEFGTFGILLEKTKTQLEKAQNTLDKAVSRTRIIDNKLDKIEALPQADPEELPSLLNGAEDPENE